MYKQGFKKTKHGKKKNITDMHAEADRKEKELQRLNEKAEQQNTGDAYKDCDVRGRTWFCYLERSQQHRNHNSLLIHVFFR